jgi:alpha-1,3-rhamnosyl/mannosyltransferase
MYWAVYPRLQAWRLRGLEDYVFHSPNFFLPPFGGRSVVTFHDLSVYFQAHTHPPERVRFMRLQIDLALQRASVIITDSEFTRQEIIDYFGWPKDSIYVVPLACGPEFCPRTAQQLVEPLRRYGLEPGGYVLFTGTIEPRKNLLTLLEAYSRLPRSLRQSVSLVLCGHRGWMSDTIHRRMQRAASEGWLKYLGYVAQEDLPGLMAGARLFVYPSYYEGFGLPVLEAMACAVPVVCSNAASLPEVAGDVPLYHHPDDVPGLTEQLRKGLEDEDWRKRAAELGRSRSRSYSWTRTAEMTLQVYHRVAELDLDLRHDSGRSANLRKK